MKRARDRGRGGVTIIEVIVAIGIITIGLLGTLPMLNYSVRSNIVAKNRGIALYLADRQVDKIKSWPAYIQLNDQISPAPDTRLDPSASGWSEGYGVRGINPENLMFGEGGLEGWDWACGGDACPNCCREYNVAYNDDQSWNTNFQRTTYLVRNGYATSSYAVYDCNHSGGVTFTLGSGTTDTNFDEGLIYQSAQNGANSSWSDALSLGGTTGGDAPTVGHQATARPPEYDPNCPTSSMYRGEDFVLVRVEVTWKDVFSQGGQHSVVRNIYIRGH
jgi:Tfp pilus assembly protein PilV